MKTTSNTSKQMHTTYKRLFVLLFMSFGFFSWGQIVSNGDFESWTGSSPDGWTTIDSGITTSQESTVVHGGNYSASIEVTTTTQSNTDFRQTVSITDSHDYHVSVWVKHTEGHIKARLYVDDYQSYSDNSNTNSWQEITYDFTANSSSIEIGLRFYDQSGFDGSEIVYVDDFTITDISSGATITVNPSSLTGFTYVEGNGPSAEQSFTVEGSNLTNDITVTPPANWEIATTSGGTYQSNALTLTQNGGTVNSTTIYTRMVAGLTNANSPFSGNIECASSGATTVDVAVDGTVDAAVPEIQITGNAIEILDGDTTPSTSDDTDFGNVEVAGTNSVTHTFTINNTGVADLTINSISSNNADFAVSGTTSGTIAAGGSSTFTVTFDPSALGTRTATITVDNDDADEGTYIFTVQGNGTNSALSDIVANASFTYTSNIDYTSYQGDPITNTSNSVGVFKFDIRDGGGSADADALGTELIDITFDVLKIANIRNASLFDGNTKLADGTVGASSISFSGLSGADYTAPDDGVKSLTLRVSFKTTVTDNDQMQFTVSSATANSSGSVFVSSDAGGATSSTTNDRNRLEVTADRLSFSVQPADQSVNTNLDTFTVVATDANNNIDLDATNNITISTTGTGMTSSSSYTLASGEVSISDVQFDTVQSGITLTATATGLTGVTSNSFNITNVATGTYRTTSDGTWPNSGTATWERFDGSSWNVAIPAANTTDLLIIRHNITSNASFAASGGVGTSMQIESGATFTDKHNSTFKNLLIKDDGNFVIKDPSVDILSGTGTVTVKSGGNLIIDSATFNNADGFWEGTENFEPGSTLKILNWDFDSGNQEEALIDNTNEVSLNSAGYYFGNIVINTNPDKVFKLVHKTGTQKLCANDLSISNQSATKNITLTNVDANVEIGGNLTINQNTFSFGSVTSSNLTHTIKGGITVAGGTLNLNQNSSGSASVMVNLEGNISTQSGATLRSTDAGCKIVFKGGGTTQTIDLSGTLGTNVDFEVDNLAVAQIINQDLELSNASNNFDVLAGGTLDFNYFSITGPGDFELFSDGILKITSGDGVNASGSTGNVQNTGTRTFSQTGEYHYVGNVSPQSTGTAMTSGSTAKRIVIDKDSDSDIVNVTQSTGTTDELLINSGILIETEVANILGSGKLTMETGGTYKTSVTSSNVPQLSGTYTINGGSIELNAAGNQVLKGGKSYKNLTFSNTGTKTISSAISTVSEIYITDDAIVDVENHTFGGSGTDFYMDTNAIYKTAGTGTKPDAQGGYMLDGASKIIFTNTVSTMEIIRLSPEYKNIVIEGNNVGTNSEISGIQIQSGGTFTVKSGASFKLKNTAGFNGGTSTAIDNTNSPTITLESGSNIEYYGDNQSITEPDNGYQNLIISGTGDKTLATNEVVVNEDLTVSSSRLLLEDGKGIKVLGNVSNDGTIEVNNQGAFVQTVDNASISGNNTNTKFILNKTSLPLNNYWEYVYWSSPINSSTFTLGDIVSNAWRYYEFDPNEANNGHTYPGWVMLSATDNPRAGVGYAISAPSGASANTILNVQFKKDHDPFNNGEIQVPILKKGGPDNVGDYNLIGNPYPSAIDFDALYNDNTAAINGSYYLWTNCAGLDANGHHQDSGYTTYTYSNGNGTAVAACNGTANQSGTASQYIATGQGFFVEAAADNQILTFKNSHRVIDNNDNFLNRPTANRDIVWLDMTNDDGKFSQAAVGFYPGATANYDAMFDAHSLNAASGFSLYSLAGTDKLVIQGLSPDNIERTIVPLGVEVSSGENITLQINRLERFDAYDIYLVDNLSGTYHNLKVSPYTLSLDAGVYEERFVLTFARVLNTDEQTATFSLILSQHNGLFRLWHSGDENIQKIAVYNLSGQLIYENNSVNKSEVEIDLHNIATGNLLVFKVTDDKGRTAVKKAVKK